MCVIGSVQTQLKVSGFGNIVHMLPFEKRPEKYWLIQCPATWEQVEPPIHKKCDQEMGHEGQHYDEGWDDYRHNSGYWSDTDTPIDPPFTPNTVW